MHREKHLLQESCTDGKYRSIVRNIELSIRQPLDYATYHWDAPLSRNVTVITSYRCGLNTIHFMHSLILEKELTRFDFD